MCGHTERRCRCRVLTNRYDKCPRYCACRSLGVALADLPRRLLCPPTGRNQAMRNYSEPISECIDMKYADAVGRKPAPHFKSY